VPQSLASPLEECLLPVRHAKSVGADNTHAVRVHVTESLTETLEACEGACGDLFVDAPVLFDTCAETNHLAQTINDDELAVRITRNHHVEAVRPQVDSRQDVRQGRGQTLS